jgi:hypothetical protein
MENVFLDFPPLPNALEKIATLSEHQYGILEEAVTGAAGLDTSFARCRAIRTQLGGKLNSFDVYNILRSLIFLGNRYERSEAATPAELRDFFEFIGLDKFIPDEHTSQIYDRVGRLLRTTRESSESYEREWRLQTAIVDGAQEFDWSLELRPRFSEDGTNVEEFYPVILFRVIVSNDRGDETPHVFQMTEESIEELVATLDAIKDQVMVLRRSARSGSLFVFSRVPEYGV